MKTYRITISRQMPQTHDLEIEAENEDDAWIQANQEIANISEDDWDDGVVGEDPEISKVVELTYKDEEVTDSDGEAA
jgi:hypothetical protein